MKTEVVALICMYFNVFDNEGESIINRRLLIYLKRMGEPWNSPWSSSLMAAAEWQAAAVLASMMPSHASNRARPERNECRDEHVV